MKDREDMPERIPKLEERLTNVEQRLVDADKSRVDVETRLVGVLQSLQESVDKLSTSLAAQEERNSLQDKDLERLKQTVHGWMAERFKDRQLPATVGLSTCIPLVIQIVAHFMGVGQ